MSVSAEKSHRNELLLVKALAVAISQRLREILQKEDGVGLNSDWCICNLATEDFEVACATLCSLGVVTPALRSDKKDPRRFKDGFRRERPFSGGTTLFYIYSATEVELLIETQHTADWPPVEDVIDAYLRVTTDYGECANEHLPTPRKHSFTLTHKDQVAPMEALVLNGYAAKSRDQYCWSEKIAPLMIKLWQWNEADIVWQSVERNKVHKQTAAIISFLATDEGEDLRRDFRHLSIAFRALEILQRWDGSVWSSTKLTSPLLGFDEAMAISLELEKISFQ